MLQFGSGPISVGTTAYCSADALYEAPTEPGSRRRRLWELKTHIHCPVIGACLPIAALRRLIDKKLGGQALATDYELHCGTITECQRRTPVAEAVHKELDRRYALALRHAAGAKTTQALAQWWRDASTGPDLPGALWATLTHSRCTPALEEQVVAEVHMLQHQVGTAQRVDQAELRATKEENAALQAELAALQQRHQQQVAAHTQVVERMQSDLVRARAEVIGLGSTVAMLREEMATLEPQAQEKCQRELVRQNQWQGERIIQLERALALAQTESDSHRRRRDEGSDHAADCHLDAAQAEQDLTELAQSSEPVLVDRSILCVGGRPASVPLYRHIVERTGGRFLHHDGGEEQSVSRLDATLAAADLVICQTGCISHDAYWRVKDHCKRTGKPCVFVENPGSASLKRALAELQPLASA